jgi:sulfate adenylyltransferase
MINPVGSDKLLPLFVDDETLCNALLEEAQELPSVEVSSAAAANAVMFGGGYFTPLQGYMNLARRGSLCVTPTSRVVR